MWTRWSSLSQQQHQGLGLFSTHSQALGTAARYQRLRHHCAAHTHSCCYYWLCCSENSDSMHERVLVTVRIYLVLAHVCLICCPDSYHRMAVIGKDLWRWAGPAPCSSKATRCWLPRSMPRQLLNDSEDGDSTASLGTLLQCSVTGQRRVSQHTFVPGVAPPQVQDLALHEVSLSPFLQPYRTVIYEVNCYRIIYLH